MPTITITQPFANPDALWEWVKRECEGGNVEQVSLETVEAQVPLDEEDFLTLPCVEKKVLTITLGGDIEGVPQ